MGASIEDTTLEVEFTHGTNRDLPSYNWSSATRLLVTMNMLPLILAFCRKGRWRQPHIGNQTMGLNCCSAKTTLWKIRTNFRVVFRRQNYLQLANRNMVSCLKKIDDYVRSYS
jgi:hypothetical protein